MKLTKSALRQIILEELNNSDKAEIKKIAKDVAQDEAERAIKKAFKEDLQKEVEKALKGKGSKEEIADISKKVIKKLYRELSFNYPHLIDRIKV